MDVLRHSYGTYRLPILKSADALALEMGNSADMIFRHYRRPVSEATARAYFAIVPNTQSQTTPVDSHSNATDQTLTKELLQTGSGNTPRPLQTDSAQAA